MTPTPISRLQYTVASVSYGVAIIGGALIGLYAALSLYFLVTGGVDALMAEASGVAAAARKQNGESPPFLSIVSLVAGAAAGFVGGAHTWQRLALRLFHIDRQEARRILAGNPSPMSRTRS